MRDPKRIDEIADILKDVWKKVPDWRVTQLIINASDTEHDCGPVFFMEDDELVRRLRRLSSGIDNATVQPGASE